MAKATNDDKLAEALLGCLSINGWEQCNPALLARQARVPMATAKAFLERQNCCRKLATFITRLTLRDYRHDKQNTSRDALFDIMMLRFDVLQNNRAAIENLSHAARRDPRLAIAILQALPEQMAALLRSAHCGDTSPTNTIALTAIYLAVFAVWSRDETADLTRTMAALDKQLNRAEAARNKLSFICKTPNGF
ncbi:MAG: hypothetical protein KBA75_03560 [Alphaproteobacteria bacterium]|nr:hypothetical protein [Alphaproteobacteria bacterium]